MYAYLNLKGRQYNADELRYVDKDGCGGGIPFWREPQMMVLGTFFSWAGITANVWPIRIAEPLASTPTSPTPELI